jgi:hypothetical protein
MNWRKRAYELEARLLERRFPTKVRRAGGDPRRSTLLDGEGGQQAKDLSSIPTFVSSSQPEVRANAIDRSINVAEPGAPDATHVLQPPNPPTRDMATRKRSDGV